MAIIKPDTFQPIGTAAANVLAQVPLFHRPYPSVALSLARYRAKKAVEHQLRAKGVRLTTFPCAELNKLAQAYLETHRQELLDQAMAAVQSDPVLRKMAEQEERNRERQRRKMRKSGLLDLLVTPDRS